MKEKQLRQLVTARKLKTFPGRITGVYFLLVDGRVVYVGQSLDIGGRLAIHPG